MGKIYKRNGTWHLYYLGVDGKRVRRTSHTSDEKAALAMLAEAEGQIALEKKARRKKAAAGMGQAADQTIPARIERLENAVRRLVQLHLSEFATLRDWAATEISSLDAD
jgi:hypothetical protein